MITGRVLEHWNTVSMTYRASVLHQINPIPLISMHPHDTESMDIRKDDAVLIRSRQDEIATHVRVDEAIAVGSLFIHFAFYESAANMLTSDALDSTGKILEFKHAPESIEKTTIRPVHSSYSA